MILDKRNTHTPAALYQAFQPAEAKRILDRLELHYTHVLSHDCIVIADGLARTGFPLMDP